MLTFKSKATASWPHTATSQQLDTRWNRWGKLKATLTVPNGKLVNYLLTAGNCQRERWIGKMEAGDMQGQGLSFIDRQQSTRQATVNFDANLSSPTCLLDTFHYLSMGYCSTDGGNLGNLRVTPNFYCSTHMFQGVHVIARSKLPCHQSLYVSCVISSTAYLVV